MDWRYMPDEYFAMIGFMGNIFDETPRLSKHRPMKMSYRLEIVKQLILKRTLQTCGFVEVILSNEYNYLKKKT